MIIEGMAFQERRREYNNTIWTVKCFKGKNISCQGPTVEGLVVQQIKVSTTFASTGVKYVFFSTDGKCITLLDYDIFNIRQKYEDGVMLTTIANEYNMSEVTVCRILNYVKNLKQ